jgi:small subunit ribosomal protein S16
MAVKIRLARKGRKSKAYYHIVVADSRSPRDGRYIEKIGMYNPLTNPATIELDFDKALGWLQNGALPTETCRAILSYKGVLMKKHLLEGVRKGAFDEAESNKRFEAWIKQNDERIEAKRSGLEKSQDDELSLRLEAERKINEARAARLTKKQVELAAKAEAESQPETPTEGETPAETIAEAESQPETPTEGETPAEIIAEAESQPETAPEDAATEDPAAEAASEPETSQENASEEKPQE